MSRLWEPYNDGAGKRIWFLARADSEHMPVAARYHCNGKGDLVRYASHETALKAADKLNKSEAEAGHALLRLGQAERRIAELGGRAAKDGQLASILGDLRDTLEGETS